MPCEGIETGRAFPPLTANDSPVTLTAVICTAAILVFDRMMLEFAVWPRVMDPNVTDAAEAESEPVCALVAV